MIFVSQVTDDGEPVSEYVVELQSGKVTMKLTEAHAKRYRDMGVKVEPVKKAAPKRSAKKSEE